MSGHITQITVRADLPGLTEDDRDELFDFIRDLPGVQGLAMSYTTSGEIEFLYDPLAGRAVETVRKIEEKFKFLAQNT